MGFTRSRPGHESNLQRKQPGACVVRELNRCGALLAGRHPRLRDPNFGLASVLTAAAKFPERWARKSPMSERLLIGLNLDWTMREWIPAHVRSTVHMGCAWGPYGERVEHVESVWGPDRAERNHFCSAQPFARPPILATWGYA